MVENPLLALLSANKDPLDEYGKIENSLCFKPAANTHLKREYTGGDPNARVLLHFSCKRGDLGRHQNLYWAESGTSWYMTHIGFDVNDQLFCLTYNTSSVAYGWVSNRKFRDPSAHLEITFVIDTSIFGLDARSVWINGVKETDLAQSTYANSVGMNHYIMYGVAGYPELIGTGQAVFDGYISRVIGVVDNAGVYTHEDFGLFHPTIKNYWRPKVFKGDCGTNGFHLNFADASNATALGYDVSGNGNHWTPVNISTNDQTTDTPTNNFATLNPMKTGGGTLSNGNLSANNGSTSAWYATLATQSIPKEGKWKWEIEITAANYGWVSVVPANVPSLLHDGYNGAGCFAWYVEAGEIKYEGTVLTTVTAAVTGDICEVRVSDGVVSFYKNETLQYTFTTTLDDYDYDYFPAAWMFGSAGVHTYNFGATGFTYEVEGYQTLCTKNLPMPEGAALKPYEHHHVELLNHDGVSTSFELPWDADEYDTFFEIKRRDAANSWYCCDGLRGYNKILSPDLTSAESTANYILMVDGTTITMGSDMGAQSVVIYAWKAGGAAVINNDGSISSQVSANPEAGFSIVKFTGAQAVGTVGHGLGKPPKFTIVKSMGSITNWHCYHSDVGNTKSIRLNLTSAPDTATSYWNDTSPTDSVFSLGTSDEANPSGVEVVAYCFAEIEGYSKIGSYTGNGSTDGTFVHCGFQPKYVLIKRTDAANDWVCLDSERDPYNQVDSSLFPNSASAEATNGFYNSDFTAAGFKVRASNVVVNASGGTYIYLAFAESPFRYSNAR